MTSNSTAPLPIEGPVLLTGATGFLGAHLLHELLVRTDASITCLSRGRPEAARAALGEKLGRYFPELEQSRFDARMRVVAADLTASELGVSGRVYDDLADDHRLILNVAANVGDGKRAQDFFPINTELVATLIELAKRGAPKALHQISTVSVAGHFAGTPPISAFTEQHLEEGQTFADPYGESKYQAEVLMRRAFSEGIPGGVYRVGFIGPHADTGRFQENIAQSYIASYVRACVRLGFAPYLPDTRVRVVPVDAAARAIATLLATADGPGRTYHIDHPTSVSQYDVIRALHAAGYAIRLLAPADFVAKSAALAGDESGVELMLPREHGDAEHPAVPFDSSFSAAELRRRHFEYPPVTSEWIARFLDHAVEVGFIEPPRHQHAAAPVTLRF
jgi:thioester reductase-like protein